MEFGAVCIMRMKKELFLKQLVQIVGKNLAGNPSFCRENVNFFSQIDDCRSTRNIIDTILGKQNIKLTCVFLKELLLIVLNLEASFLVQKVTGVGAYVEQILWILFALIKYLSRTSGLESVKNLQVVTVSLIYSGFVIDS